MGCGSSNPEVKEEEQKSNISNNSIKNIESNNISQISSKKIHLLISNPAKKIHLFSIVKKQMKIFEEFVLKINTMI